MPDCRSCGFKPRRTAEFGYHARISSTVIKGETVSTRDLETRTDVPRQKIYSTMESLVTCGLFEVVDPTEPDYPDWYEYAGKAAQRNWRVCNGVPRKIIKKWIKVM